jgi:hypothetical protein
MSGEHQTSAKVSIGRIARMAIGTTIVLLTAFWIAFPIVVLGG